MPGAAQCTVLGPGDKQNSLSPKARSKNPHNFLYLCAHIWSTVITSVSVFPGHTKKETADL